MSAQLLIRIDPELKKQVDLLAKSEGKNTSALVREVLQNYVRERDTRAYIDGLWERIGKDLKNAGARQTDVEAAIGEARLARR